MELLTSENLNKEIKSIELQAWNEAGQLYSKAKNATLIHLYFFPFFGFLKTFFFKGTIFKGIPGLTSAALDAYLVFQRYSKLILLKKEMK